jgi:hypothetical protein
LGCWIMIFVMPSSCSCTLGAISHLVHYCGGFTFIRLLVFKLNYDLHDAFLLFLHPRSCFPLSSLLWWVHYYKVVSCFNLCSPFVARNLSLTISLCTRPICLWKLFWCWPKNVGPYAICARWGIFGFQAMVNGSLRWKLMGNYFEELRNLNEELELKFWLSLFRVFFHQGSRSKFFLTPLHCAILIFWSSPCPVTLFGYLLCLSGMPPETYIISLHLTKLIQHIVMTFFILHIKIL